MTIIDDAEEVVAESDIDRCGICDYPVAPCHCEEPDCPGLYHSLLPGPGNAIIEHRAVPK
jgi:hypothetical protein